MLRSIGVVILSVFVGVFLIMGIHLLGQKIYPPPEGFDPQNREMMRDLLTSATTGMFLFILTSHAIGTLAGGFLAAWLAGRRPIVHALVAGVFFLAAGILNLVWLPFHPLWFNIVDPVLYLPVACIGACLAPRKAV
jgi:hypothetical protein